MFCDIALNDHKYFRVSQDTKFYLERTIGNDWNELVKVVYLHSIDSIASIQRCMNRKDYI